MFASSHSRLNNWQCELAAQIAVYAGSVNCLCKVVEMTHITGVSAGSFTVCEIILCIYIILCM